MTADARAGREEQAGWPAGARTAWSRLEEGNARYAAALAANDALEVGLSAGRPRDGVAAAQTPFAAALGCADARVPVETVFGCGPNEMFVTRVAGNIAAPACVGSLQYAVANLPELEVVVVLGHRGCGALAAAVDLTLAPASYPELRSAHELRSVVDALFGSVALTAAALPPTQASDRDRLLDAAILVHATFTAASLAERLDVPVLTGVADLVTGEVCSGRGATARTGLTPAPQGPFDVAKVLSEAG